MRVFYGLLIVAVALALVWPASTAAYPLYRGAPACDDCHPGFTGLGPLHDLHGLFVSECFLCHAAAWDNPPLSNCAGCHLEDGLVLHHDNAGAPPDANGLKCITCHPGAVQGAETQMPPYYLLAGVLVTDPCFTIPAPPGEDFDGDGKGLDNDGDLLYDQNDPDCGVPVEETTWGRIKALYE